jgi:hypothetical protein
MPAFEDMEQQAKVHGNLMDKGVAEVEKEPGNAADKAAAKAGGLDREPIDKATDGQEEEVEGQHGGKPPGQ